MSSKDDQNKKNVMARFFDKLDIRFGESDPAQSSTVAEYLMVVLSNIKLHYELLLYMSFSLAVPSLIIYYVGYHFDLGFIRSIGQSFLIVSLLSLAWGLLNYFQAFGGTYKNQLEVKCPKCEEYIPLYQWQCPKCKTTHADRHIFLNCNKCDMKVGKLHKNLQSIKCINESCGYDLYFYEPYEGGFNEKTFRGEE